MRERRGAQIPLDVLVDAQAKAAGWPKPFREYRFHPERKWRFDYAWEGQRNIEGDYILMGRMLAVEIQGGIWTGGKHGRGSGIVKDYEKLNHAQALGWKVLQLTPQQVRKGELQSWLEKMR